MWWREAVLLSSGVREKQRDITLNLRSQWPQALTPLGQTVEHLLVHYLVHYLVTLCVHTVSH